MPEANARIDHACARCGSLAVTRDAWAEWRVEQQGWAVAHLFDTAFCHQCLRETDLVARPVLGTG